MLQTDVEMRVILIIARILKANNLEVTVTSESALIGRDPILDSMGLVELCVELEDIAADDYGFDFDWTSEKAMSASKSMFKSVAALTKEFIAQWSITK